MPILVAPGHPGPTASTDSTTYNGVLRAVVDPVHAGVTIICDFSSYLAPGFGYTFPVPFTATVYRVMPDGTTIIVRSGEAVESYGGIFHVYDDEVPMGQVVGYYAIPQTADGGTGPTSGVAAVLSWEPDGGFTSPGVWLKCLDDPDLSMPVRVQDWSTGSYASGTNAVNVLGSPFPVANVDVRKAYASQVTVLTSTEDEYQQLLAASQTGIAYLVGLERHRRRTGYYLLGDMAPTRQGNVNSAYDSWVIPLQQIDRPLTAGQTLAVPGKTLSDRQAAFPFFSDIVARDPSCEAVLSAVATARFGMKAATGGPVSFQGYTGAVRVNYPSGGGSRVMRATATVRDASNASLGVVLGPNTTVRVGGDKMLFVYLPAAPGVSVTLNVEVDGAAASDTVDVYTAGLYADGQMGVNLLPAASAGFDSGIGNWESQNNATLSAKARVGRRFRATMEP